MAMGIAERAHRGPAPACGPAAVGAGAAAQDVEMMLRGMERTGSADPALPGRIADMRRAADGARSRWEASQSGDWFFACQVAYKAGLVLGQMAKRISAEAGGGPGTASDMLSVMPAVSRALEIAGLDASYDGLEDDALEALVDLMDRSRDAGLDTPIGELDETIDWDKWDRIMPEVVRSLEA